MSNKKKDYWQKRFELLEEAQNRKGAEFMEDVERIYNRAIRETEKEISEWYVRFAKKEGISLTEAKRLLNTRELKEFRMTVKEYIEKGKTLNISDTWAKELERASSKVHVSRLEALKVQMQQQVETLTAFKGDEIDDLMRDIYTDSYYKTAFEVQKGIGVGWEVHRLDVDSVNKTLAKPWAADGSNFSERIWGKQRPELIKRLHDGLTINLAKGESPDKLIKQIHHEFNVDKSKAARLVYTEKAYFQTLAQLDSFKELGVEEFEVCATLDNKTSEICQAMDGKHFPLKDFQVGVTAPPFHCYCRTATCPYFDDEFTIDETRAARDKEGKYYTVPSNLKYKDWKEAFVDNAGEGFVENISKYGFKEFTRPLAEAVVQNAVTEVFKTIATKQDAINYLEKTFATCNLDKVDEMDEQIFIDQTKALQEVEDKFGAIKESGANFSIGNDVFETYDGKDALGFFDDKTFMDDGVTRKLEISINPKSFENVDDTKKLHRKAVGKNRSMDCLEGYETSYTAMHEYGHLLQDNYIYKPYNKMLDEYKLAEKELSEIKAALDKETNIVDKLSLHNSFMDKNDELDVLKRKLNKFISKEAPAKAEEIRNEIMHLAIDIMIEEDQTGAFKEIYDEYGYDGIDSKSLMSTYGNTSPYEYFAEAFANSQGGKPNVIGKAMVKWLEKNIGGK